MELLKKSVGLGLFLCMVSTCVDRAVTVGWACHVSLSSLFLRTSGCYRGPLGGTEVCVLRTDTLRRETKASFRLHFFFFLKSGAFQL